MSFKDFFQQIWWSFTGRCLRCGAARYAIVPTTRCERHYREECERRRRR